MTDVAFHPHQPDHERLLSASLDGTVREWDATRPADHLELAGHVGPATMVAFRPDNAGPPLLASLSRQEARVRFWDPETGQQIGDPLGAPADRLRWKFPDPKNHTLSRLIGPPMVPPN